MSHTPGPWTVDDGIDSNGFFYYIIDAARDIDGQTESRANARLIAAAPEFYESAVVALKNHDEEAKRSNFPRCGCLWCGFMRPIVQKAEGVE